MKQEIYPRIDPKLVDLLEKMYPPLEYDPELTSEQWTRKCSFRAGQIELINKLKTICNKQKESGGTYGW